MDVLPGIASESARIPTHPESAISLVVRLARRMANSDAAPWLDGQPRSAVQAVQDTAGARADEPTVLGSPDYGLSGNTPE
jgi:hypothetical protein